MSEGEGDGDLEGMEKRVAALENCLNQKAFEANQLSVEFEGLRADASSPNSSQSQSSSIHGKDLIQLYHNKVSLNFLNENHSYVIPKLHWYFQLHEFEVAIQERDKLINDMSNSLKQALHTRDTVIQQLSVMKTMQLPEGGKILQEKVSILDT